MKKSRVQFNIDQRQTDVPKYREAVYTQTRKYNDQIRQEEANFIVSGKEFWFVLGPSVRSGF